MTVNLFQSEVIAINLFQAEVIAEEHRNYQFFPGRINHRKM